MRKEGLRIIRLLYFFPHIQFSKAVESKVSDIMVLHLKDFCCASRRTEVVGISSAREHASMLLIVEQTHNSLDVTPLLIIGQ